MDAADPGGRQIDLIDRLIREEAPDGRLVQEVECRVMSGDDFMAQPAETTRQCLANHAEMPRNKDSHMFFRWEVEIG